MKWDEARELIEVYVMEGADISTPGSPPRIVAEVEPTNGFTIAMEENVVIRIPWEMLQTCLDLLNRGGRLDAEFLKKRFPVQTEEQPALIDVVGRIFVRGGIALEDADTYRLRGDYL